MADTAERLRYTGEAKPVAVKQMAQEDSGAHPEHAGVDGQAGGSTGKWVDEHSSHGGASGRRWRCFGGCGGRNDQATRHKAPRQHGEYRTTLRKDRGSPQSFGHGEAGSPVTLPAARKKGTERRFPTKSSCKGGSAGCARSKRSYDGFAVTRTALRRRRELDGAMAVASGKQRRGKEKNGDGTSFVERPGSKEMTRSNLLMPARSRRRPWACLERRRRSSVGTAARWYCSN